MGLGILSDFNKEDYIKEYYPNNISPNVYEKKWNPSPIGYLQKKQEDLTSEIKFNEEEYYSAYAWNTFFYKYINDYLYKTLGWRDLEEKFKSIPLICDALSSVINKSPRLQENTILYRLGYLSDNIQVGDKGLWKGFVSTSYNPYYISFVKRTGGLGEKYKDKLYTIKIYAPKGTKGAVFQESLGCDKESELLLDKGQKYILIDKDEVKKTAEILLY